MMLFSRRVWLLARRRKSAWASSSLGPPLSSRSDSTDEPRTVSTSPQWMSFLSLGQYPSHSDLTSWRIARHRTHLRGLALGRLAWDRVFGTGSGPDCLLIPRLHYAQRCHCCIS